MSGNRHPGSENNIISQAVSNVFPLGCWEWNPRLLLGKL